MRRSERKTRPGWAERLNTQVVEEFRANGGKLLIIGSYRGADIHPAWVHNLRANPQAHIELGAESYDVIARELPPEERDPLWVKIVAAAPGFGEYQQNTSRVIPLIELTRA